MGAVYRLAHPSAIEVPATRHDDVGGGILRRLAVHEGPGVIGEQLGELVRLVRPVSGEQDALVVQQEGPGRQGPADFAR